MAGEPTVNPNELAAPSSGFGQTVSFAFDPRGNTPQQRAITSNGPRIGGASGGARAGYSDPNVRIPKTQVDPTAALLMKAAEGFLSVKVEEARNEQFMQGMSRVAEGEALADIKAGKPWYSQIFGDTPDVEGARAYTAQDTVNRVLTEQTAMLPDLAKLSPQEAAKHFNKVTRDSLTGDSAADALIMKGMMDQLPSLMKAQSKANVAYRQSTAANAMAQQIGSAAQSLQQLGESYAQDVLTKEDFEQQSQAFVMKALPPAGINEENYKKTLTQSMVNMAHSGQFHAVEALRKTGVLNALDEDQRGKVEKALVDQGTKARDRYAFKFAPTLAEIKSDSGILPNGMTPADIGKRIDQANSAYKRLTGSPVDLITSDQKADLLVGSLNYIKREAIKAEDRQQTLRDRNATEDAKAAAAAEQAAKVSQYIADGDVMLAKKATKATDDEIDLEFMRQASADKTAAGYLMLNNFVKSGYVNSIMSNRFQSELRLAEGFDPSTGARRDSPTDGWFKSVQLYDTMRSQNPDMAASYFGDYAPRLERASRMLQGVYDGTRGDEARIFTSTMDRSGVVKRNPLSTKEVGAVVEKIKDTNSNAVVRWWTGKVPLTPGAIDTLSKFAAQSIEDWRMADMTDEEAVERGIAQTLSSGRVEVIGGYVIKNPDAVPGKKPESIKSLMSGAGAAFTAIPEGEHDEYFQGFLRDQMKVPENLGGVTFTRRGDAGFVLSGFDPETSQAVVYPMSYGALQQYAAERTQKATANGKKRYAYGPAISYTADVPDEQNYQISAEERARRQAEKERKSVIRKNVSQIPK